MNLEEKLGLFFKEPTIKPVQGQAQGTLYLLRREIQDCLIGKVLAEGQVPEEASKDPHRIFATVMVIAAGVDLLAKFYAGSDDVGGVRKVNASGTYGRGWLGRLSAATPYDTDPATRDAGQAEIDIT